MGLADLGNSRKSLIPLSLCDDQLFKPPRAVLLAALGWRRRFAMPPQVAPVSAVVTEDGLRHRSKARGLLNASNLPALQNLIKRDPGAYVEDFRAQWNHYESLRRIYASMAGVELADGGAASSAAQSGISASSYAVRSLSKEDEDKFVALLAFVTQLAPSYPDITASLFSQLSSLLLEHHSAISKDVRAACVRSLVLMRNRSVISSEQCVSLS